MVRKILTLLLLFPLLGHSAPLDLDTNKAHNVPPAIKNFKQWFGDIDYGWVYYLSTSDIAGFETELHLKFVKKKIVYAIMIFGPSGLNENNCVKKYKKIINILNDKYGQYNFIKHVKDPIIDDLIVMAPCHPFRIGAYQLETRWSLTDVRIISKLLGDDDGYYIETEYYFNNYKPIHDNVLKTTL